MKNSKTDLIIRPNLMPETFNFTNKLIVAGFPGTGKSTAAKNDPETFLDMESSDYHWVYKDGVKIAHPEWPNNYIEAILEQANKTYDMSRHIYICTSTHKEVLDEFKARELYFMAVVPKTKSLYIQRYRDRGSSQEFIDLLDKKFEDFIGDIENSTAFGIYYTDGYLQNVWHPDSEDINVTPDFTGLNTTEEN